MVNGGMRRGFDPLAGRGRSMEEATGDLIESNSAELSISSELLIPYDGVTVTSKGLHFTRALSQDEWWTLLILIGRFDGAAQWMIGDALNYGDNEYGVTLDAVAEYWGYEKQSLKTYAWVAKQVKSFMRINDLSFTHHMRVAGLEPALQKAWLGFASKYALTDTQFRKFMALVDAAPQFQLSWLDQVVLQKPEREQLLTLIETAKSLPPEPFDRLVTQVDKVRDQADKLLLKQDATSRAELRQLAAQQMIYWQQVQAILGDGDETST